MSANRLALAIIMASVLLPQALGATSIGGNQLFANCAADDKAAPTTQHLVAGVCIGYVTAIMDVLAAGNSVNRLKACIPIGADMNQIVAVVKNFLRDYPEKRHHVAAGLVAEAFARAFPCRPAR